MTALPHSSRLARRVARTSIGRFVRRAASFLLYRVVYGRNHAMRIRAGNHFPNRSGRTLPIIVIVASGLHDGDSERLVGEVERAQLAAKSFRPLFVIETGEFAPFRRRGYVVERVMSAEELAAVNPNDDYGEYVESRLDIIVRRYGASSVRTVGPSDVGQVCVELLDRSKLG